jgi:hypothetical protein
MGSCRPPTVTRKLSVSLCVFCAPLQLPQAKRNFLSGCRPENFFWMSTETNSIVCWVDSVHLSLSQYATCPHSSTRYVKGKLEDNELQCLLWVILSKSRTTCQVGLREWVNRLGEMCTRRLFGISTTRLRRGCSASFSMTLPQGNNRRNLEVPSWNHGSLIRGGRRQRETICRSLRFRSSQ